MSKSVLNYTMTNQAKIAVLDTQVRELLALVAAMQQQLQIHSDRITILQGRRE